MQDLELWCYLQRAIERQIFRRPSHHDLEVAWNHAPVHVNIQQLEIFRVEKTDGNFRMGNSEKDRLAKAVVDHWCTFQAALTGHTRFNRETSAGEENEYAEDSFMRQTGWSVCSSLGTIR